jgi:iron complex transport system substrate-binding protein
MYATSALAKVVTDRDNVVAELVPPGQGNERSSAPAGLVIRAKAGRLTLGAENAPTGVSEAPSLVEARSGGDCGASLTYHGPPQRVVTMNQSATEMMFALGLQDHLVGTAYLDDATLPEFAVGYEKAPVPAAG